MPAIIASLLSKKGLITLLVAAGVILAGFMVMSYVTMKSENIVLNAEIIKVVNENKQLSANAKANERAIATRNELVMALTQVEVQERVETIKAIEANPNWAKQPIPADILASLRK